MNKVHRALVLVILLFSVISLTLLVAPSATAADPTPACNAQQGSNGEAVPGWCIDQFKQDNSHLADPTVARGYLGDVISTGLNLLLIVGALAAFAMFVFGGFMYITSNGDPAKAQTARQTMKYAAIGLIIMSMTYVVILIYNNLLPAK